ncbi:MAG: hypothetical protein II770_02125, partial [Bacteroidales bacterium]|nr:hypothetical protein [Bacteroidales bacterium]
MRPGLWIDLVFCIIILPILLLIFPIEDWVGWNPFYVLWFVSWIYINYFLHRRVSALMMLSGSGWRWTSVALIFISAAITFLMSLKTVGEEDLTATPRLDTHQQELWILYVVTTFCGLAVGIQDILLRKAKADKALKEHHERTKNDLELRSEETAGDMVTVKAGYMSVTLPVSDIQYVESRGNYACIHREHGN